MNFLYIKENIIFTGHWYQLMFLNLKCQSKKEKRSQRPDLFCYSKDMTDWFFCDVKGEGDGLKQDQSKYFETIESLSRKEMYLIKTDKKPSLRQK